MSESAVEQQIKNKAFALGFAACGIASCKTFERDSQALESWIKNNYHADMDFMARHKDKRKNPVLLHEGAKSVIVVLLNYYNPDYLLQKKSDYSFVNYTLGKDYHVVMKEKLTNLSEFLTLLFPNVKTRCFVDSAPVFEKAFAVEAGLGWIGKNTLLINPKGSLFFIGELFTDVELHADQNISTHDCGSCNECVKACPTNALKTPYVLDANKCLSYQSIERKQLELGESVQPYLSEYIYGCDICQRVCPYNVHAEPTKIAEFKVKDEILNFSNSEWESLSETEFNRIFADSAVKRLGYQKFMENIKLAKEQIDT